MKITDTVHWRRVGPGQVCCKTCGKIVSTNALAKASHMRSKAHQAAADAEAERLYQRDFGGC